MDENSVTEYGWIVIVIAVIAVLLAFVPFLNNMIVDNTAQQIKAPLEDGGETVTNYTQKDIEDSNGRLIAIGKTNKLNVVARFTSDYESVIITKNGVDSDGIIGEIPESYRDKFLSVTITDGVVAIGQNAFAGCVNLKGIDIATSVKSIEKGAFSGCTSLVSIAFSGTESDWNAISLGDDWDKNTGSYVLRYEC